MPISKPDLTQAQFTAQVTELGQLFPFLSNEQKWGVVYASWKANDAAKQAWTDDKNPFVPKTAAAYFTEIMSSAADSYYATVVDDKRVWISELSASPEMTTVLLNQAKLPQNAGKSLAAIASDMPFLYNL